MKKIAEERGVDLLLVDSGDLHDGDGLSDGFPAGGIDGQEVGIPASLQRSLQAHIRLVKQVHREIAI